MHIQPLPIAGALTLSETGAVLECAQAFERLLDYEYHFVAGKKGKLREFTISFRGQDFYYLAGVHKLKDIYNLGKTKSNALKLILDGKLTDEALKKSAFYQEIEPRLFVLQHLEMILDDNDMVYRFLKSKCPGSMLKADWLLEGKLLGHSAYVFITPRLSDDLDPQRFVCCSVFRKDKRDYALHQPRYTLLQKRQNIKSVQTSYCAV